MYDLSSLKELLSSLRIEKVRYFEKSGQNWLPASLNDVKNVECEENIVRAVALVVAKKVEEYEG